MWQRTDTQKRDLWKDGRPADDPVFGDGKGRSDVLGRVERRHLRVEGTEPGADRAGGSWGAWITWFLFLKVLCVEQYSIITSLILCWA